MLPSAARVLSAAMDMKELVGVGWTGGVLSTLGPLGDAAMQPDPDLGESVAVSLGTLSGLCLCLIALALGVAQVVHHIPTLASSQAVVTGAAATMPSPAHPR